MPDSDSLEKQSTPVPVSEGSSISPETVLPRSPVPLPPRPPAPLHALRTHPGLLLALIIYLLLALSYFFIVPIFEGPDEWTHTGHVKYIAEGNGLPVMLPGQGIWGGQQPPLYYAVGAILVQPFELAAFDGYAERTKNPHASLGYALDPGNKNNYLHHPNENFPYRGLSLTVHVLRLYSITFGLITLIFTYFTALEILDFRFWILDFPLSNPKSKIQNPKSFAALVALFVACQPMFGFITALVANEPANMAFCAIGLWLAQRYVLYGPSRHWKRAAALGVVLGLISLSKMTGLSFGLVAVVAMLQTAIATRKQPGAARLLWRDGIIIGALFLAVGGWWYWRNYQLYGDFFQQGLYKIYFNVDPQPLTLSDFLYTLSTGEVSFWATFGWLNIVAPNWVYTVYRIISRVGLAGAAVAIIANVGIWKIGRLEGWKVGNWISRITPSALRLPASFITHHSSFIIHLVFPIALAFSLTRLVATEGGLQGRQLLPALGSMAIVIVWGWWALTPDRLRLPVFGLLAAVWLGLAFWLPYTVVAREYIPRPLLVDTDLPANLARLNLTYNDEMKLLGVEIGTDKIRPGERVPVTVYWQALKPMTTNYSVFVHLIGRDYQSVGQFNTYPGLGLRPTTTLLPGQIVADTYPVPANGGSQAPTRLLVNAGLFNFNEPGRPGIPAIAPDGNPAPPTVGQIKLIPAAWPSPSPDPPLAEFADNIRLAGYDLKNCTDPDDACVVVLKWHARARPSIDYTVFVQLWRNDEKVAGFDAPPLNNDYPTSLWDAGEVILDPHPLDLSAIPPGEYRVLTGLYNFTTGDRLPAESGGAPLPDYAVDLGAISITP